MSTAAHSARFHAGFCFTPEAFFDQFARAMSPIRMKLERAEVARDVAQLVDRADTRFAERPANPVTQVIATIKGRRDESTPDSVFADPNYANVSLLEDPETGETLVFFARGDRAYDKRFLALDGVEEYGWFSAEEPRDGVSQAEWGARRMAWERVLPARTPHPSYELFAARDHGPLERAANDLPALAAVVPTRRRRTFSTAHGLLMDSIPIAAFNGDFSDYFRVSRRVERMDKKPLMDVLKKTLAPLNQHTLAAMPGTNEAMGAARAELEAATAHALESIPEDPEDSLD